MAEEEKKEEAQAEKQGEAQKGVQKVGLDAVSSGKVIEPIGNIKLLMDVALNVSIELGRTKMQLKDVLNLGVGSVVELEKLAGDPVDILVNDKLVARGEVIVIEDNFGVRITEVVDESAIEE